jgi:type IV secretion system protein VirB4
VFSLKRLFKNYAEAGSFSEKLNLHSFIDSDQFLTKTGDVGMILEVRGVDYECLDHGTIDNLTKRLESAFKLFDENFRVYQYLFKRNDPEIPFKTYGNPVVDTANRNRASYLKGKADGLFFLSIFYIVLYEGFRPVRSVHRNQSGLFRKLAGFLALASAYLSTGRQVNSLDDEITRGQAVLRQRIDSFVIQIGDFLPTRILDKHEAFRVLNQILNFSPAKRDLAKLKWDTFLDYFLPDSQLECHRNFLRLDDYYLKVLTLKEPSAQSFPLGFKNLLEVQANYFIATEWKKEDLGKTRRLIHAKRRHFHNTKQSFFTQVNLNDAPARDHLTDDSKESQVRELGESLKEIEMRGTHFGRFTLTVVIYDLDLAKVERACAEFYKVFSVHDGQVYEERLNLLNAYLATVPGNHVFNFRSLYISNSNYADYSFLFTLHCGETYNHHLKQEYLAVLETNHNSPYFFNLHYRDLAHTIILGRTGSGKSFLLNFLITNLQKYDPATFIFDLGGSFESITKLFGGSYLRVGLQSESFRINPFSLPPTKENLDFLALFLKVLLSNSESVPLDASTERDVYHQIENLYSVDPSLRTLSVLANTLGRDASERLSKWTRGGQFGFVFDNADDTVSFSTFQCFDFQQMRKYPEILEPLLFYLLHRASAVIQNRDTSSNFKAFFIDEAWIFLRNSSIQRYVLEALKTWRKHNAAIVLSTQSLDELRRSDILDVLVESCPTKIFLANPDMDRDLYRKQFHLNENEIELISGLIPKQQFLLKTPELAKVANLNVDRKSYWLYTNDPYDNKKRNDAFEKYGFERGLEVLAEGQ